MRTNLALSLLLLSLGCPGTEDRVNLEPLYRAIETLCDNATCGDYSTSECKRYVFDDSVDFVFFAEEENECLDARVEQINCIHAVGMCIEVSCPFPEAECAAATTIPDWAPPEAVRDVVYEALAFQEECDRLYEPEIESERREYVTEMTALLEGIRYGYSEACFDAFVTLVRCASSGTCDPLESACADERSAQRSACE